MPTVATLECLVELGDRTYTRVAAVEIVRSMDKLLGTCTLTLARQGALAAESIRNALQPGDPVSVLLGYNGQLVPEFVGYVAKVRPGTPVVVECEDSAWALRRIKMDAIWQNVQLDAWLAEVQPFPVVAVDYDLGYLKADGVNLLQLLDKLRQKWKLRAFFRLDSQGSPQLVAGLGGYEGQTVQRVDIQQQPAPISSLRWEDGEQVPVRIEATHIKAGGQRETASYGDEGGVRIDKIYYNTPSWKTLAQEEVSRARFAGYSGQLTTFGDLSVEPGHVLELVDSQHPERDGQYYSIAQRISFTPGGGWRCTHTLGPLAT